MRLYKNQNNPLICLILGQTIITSKNPIKTLNRSTKSQNRIVNLQHI
jgi:hypothetical protein